MNIYRLLVIEVVVTKKGKKSGFSMLTPSLPTWRRWCNGPCSHFKRSLTLNSSKDIFSLAPIWTRISHRKIFQIQDYLPFKPRYTATRRRLQTTFKQSLVDKVPRLVSSGTKLLLKYQKNFVLVCLERTMACICKSVPAYSGFFCSQIDKIWGRTRLFSMKKDKTE